MKNLLQDLHHGGGFAHAQCSFAARTHGTPTPSPPLCFAFALFVVSSQCCWPHLQEGLTLASVPPPPGSAAVLSQQQPPPPDSHVAAGGRSGSLQLFTRPTLRSLVRPPPSPSVGAGPHA
jgi:hypothetical protein